ncbi:MAG: hypothetical protein RL358_1290 [Pseudomonadota bacterium]
MVSFFSKRFGKKVWITNHARSSMDKRHISDAELEVIVESGEVKHKDVFDMWIFKHIEGRADNLICAAVINKDSIIVKTVMINWELEE